MNYDDARDRHEIAASLRDLFALIEDGKLVRNVSRDHELGWAVSAAEFVLVLRRASDAIALARERRWIG